jgi:hypothetical protein
VQLGGEGGYADDLGRELAGFDDDGAAEGVAYEGDPAGRAEAVQKGDAGQDVEDAFLEFAGLAVVQTQSCDAGAEAIGEAAVEVGRSLKAAHGAADVDGSSGPILAGMKHCADLSAGCLDHDAEVAIGLRMRGYGLDLEFEVASFGRGWIFGEIHGGRIPPADGTIIEPFGPFKSPLSQPGWR